MFHGYEGTVKEMLNLAWQLFRKYVESENARLEPRSGVVVTVFLQKHDWSYFPAGLPT